MTDRIRAGAMRIEDGTVTPKSLAFDTEQYSADWSSILKPSAAQLDRELQSAEWTFFYTAGAIHVSGFGLNDRSRTDRAVAHDKSREARELQLLGDYSSEARLIFGIALHEPHRARQTYSEKSAAS